MRQKLDPQRNLLHLMAKNKVARELEAISLVLDQDPGVLDLVFRDLVKYQRVDTEDGMTAEQALRGAILKQYRELTYEEVAFHLEDSIAFRSFARLGMGQYPRGSALQEKHQSHYRRDLERREPGAPGTGGATKSGEGPRGAAGFHRGGNPYPSSH